ncbi:NEW3 domain-containing protein [Deinococcus multiflagellatus]|uniref:NEW3 domain-containing protein n=1 Tax=Deinococcus multiflagellatus TaxID=1656887 RepID=UPI001CCDCBDB|nr:NEW3 domain-containing protein [Deinococcus multiflagellatus]MBZ9713718.1 carboxypeptidase regulatory-like domain-containing protein [Deinococcus multiflagellatus]
MKRAALLTCLWLGTLSGLGAQAAVRLSGEVSGETGRGALTLRLEVRHDSGPAEEVRPTVTLPPGWRLLLPPPAVTVAPGEVRAVTLTILPPTGTPAGRYPVRVQAGEAETTIQVEVAALARASIQPLNIPGLAVGDRYEATFVVTNTGNVTLRSPVVASSALGYRVRASPAQVELAPGAQVTVTVTVTVPRLAVPSQRHLLELDLPGYTRAAARAVTELVSETLALSATHVTLPLTLRAEAEGAPGSARVVLGAQGTAQLENGAELEVDLNTRTPRLSYRQRRWSAEAGYVPFGLRFEPLQGLRLGTTDGPLTVAAGLYRQAAPLGWLSWPATPGSAPGPWNAGLEVLYLTPERRAWAEVLLGGSGWRVGSTLNLTLAPGWRLRAGGDARSDGTWQGEVGLNQASPGQTFSASLAARRVAGERQWRAAASANWPNLRGFDLGLSGAWNGGGSVTAPGYGPEGAEAQLSLGRALGWGRWSARYAYQQTATAQHANHELSVSLATDAARTLQTVLVGYGPVWRWTYSGRASLSGAGGTWTPSLDLAQVAGSPLQLGAAVAWSLPLQEGLGLTLSGGTRDALAGQWFVGAEGKYAWADGAEVAGQLNYTRGASSGLSWRLSVRVPAELPLAQRQNVGRLEGTVQDASGQPLAGVLVRAGAATTRTDAAGHYLFSALPGGPTALTVGTGPDQVVRPAVPLAVTVTPARTLTQNLRVLPGIQVVGALRLELPDPARLSAESQVVSVPPSALAGVPVGLQAEDGTITEAISSETGGLIFAALPPGRYVVVPPPEGHPLRTLATLSLEPTTLDLAPGTPATLQVRVQPRVRTVRVRSGGTVEQLPPPTNR